MERYREEKPKDKICSQELFMGWWRICLLRRKGKIFSSRFKKSKEEVVKTRLVLCGTQWKLVGVDRRKIRVITTMSLRGPSPKSKYPHQTEGKNRGKFAPRRASSQENVAIDKHE